MQWLFGPLALAPLLLSALRPSEFTISDKLREIPANDRTLVLPNGPLPPQETPMLGGMEQRPRTTVEIGSHQVRLQHIRSPGDREGIENPHKSNNVAHPASEHMNGSLVDHGVAIVLGALLAGDGKSSSGQLDGRNQNISGKDSLGSASQNISILQRNLPNLQTWTEGVGVNKYKQGTGGSVPGGRSNTHSSALPSIQIQASQMNASLFADRGQPLPGLIPSPGVSESAPEELRQSHVPLMTVGDYSSAAPNSSVIVPAVAKPKIAELHSQLKNADVPGASPSDELTAHAAAELSSFELSVNHTRSYGGSSSKREIAKSLMTNLTRDLTSKNISALRADLVTLCSSEVFDVNLPFLTVPPETQAKTLLAVLVEIGWIEGVKALLECNSNHKKSDQLLHVDAEVIEHAPRQKERVDTALLLAVKGGRADIVRILLKANASIFALGFAEATPLEVAASDGQPMVVEALLGDGSPLADGLLQLRLALRQAGDSLPGLSMGWPSGEDNSTIGIGRLQMLMPAALWPRNPTERAQVGENPSDWVLLYKARVMRALAEGISKVDSGESSSRNAHRQAHSRLEDLERVRTILVQHGFDAFARDYLCSVILFSVAFSTFGLFAYIIFRLRVYGDLDAPVSLAHQIPGAFEPSRVADADYDPSRLRTDFPYRMISDQHLLTSPSCSVGFIAFGEALLGVFCSWLLECVRIPPATNPFDEDYLSDDDDTSRETVRTKSTQLARKVRDAEVAMRIAALGTLLCWFCWRASRWMEVQVLALSYVLYSVVAACAANSFTPASPPCAGDADCSPGGSADDWDNSRLAYALFTVQHGPRWQRSFKTARSTASASAVEKRSTPKSDRRTRRQKRSPKTAGAQDTQPDSTCGDLSSAGSGAENMDGTTGPAVARETSETAFAKCWHRAYLQSGVMHTFHSDYLSSAICSLVTISITLLWLSHWRPLAHGSLLGFYDNLPAALIFSVYGAPGTLDRFAALLIELLWLGLAGERLFGITSLARTVALSLQQRYAGLMFVAEHPPPVGTSESSVGKMEDGACENTAVKDAGAAPFRVDECLKQIEFTCELSKLRWQVLRAPFSIALMFVVLCLLVASLIPPLRAYVHALPQPTLFLCIGLCLLPPMLSALHSAALSNQEIARQRAWMQEEIGAALAASAGSSQDDQHCHLLAVGTALQDCAICWQSGRAIGFTEPAALLLLAVSATLLCVAASGMVGLL